MRQQKRFNRWRETRVETHVRVSPVASSAFRAQVETRVHDAGRSLRQGGYRNRRIRIFLSFSFRFVFSCSFGALFLGRFGV